MSQQGFYAGVVRKKYTIFCLAPDGAQVELATCYDETAARTAQAASKKIMDLMAESFEMDEEFQILISETMESADDIPLAKVSQPAVTQ